MTKTTDIAYTVAVLGLLIAMQILLGSFFTIQFLMTKITFSFLITAVMAQLFSARITISASALASIIGMLLFPKFSFFLGFALTAGLTGFIFHYFFYHHAVNFWRIFVSSLLVTFGCNLILNSIWLHIMYQLSWKVLLLTRLPQELISLVVYTILLTIFLNLKPIKKIVARFSE